MTRRSAAGLLAPSEPSAWGRRACIIVALSWAFLGACSRDLSRAEAKRLLDQRSRTLELDLHTPALTCAEKAGFIERTTGRGCAYAASCYFPTPKSARLFRAFEWRPTIDPTFNAARVSLPLQQVATVTGIADFPPAPGVKEVQYRYEWDVFALPAELQPCLTPHTTAAPNGPGIGGGTDRAFLRRYDDGWRIEE